MKIVLSEGQFNNLMESMRFDWKNGTYKWVNDKKDTNINTSLTRKAEDDTAEYGYKIKELPRSKVLTYNLFDIKSFYVTQALKHNKVKRYLNKPTERGKKSEMVNLKPDKSIKEFKEYTVRYIIRLLNRSGFDVDVILSPQSSSNFNDEMIKLIGSTYSSTNNKPGIIIKSNAFIKNPGGAVIDKSKLTQNLTKEIGAYEQGLSDREFKVVLQTKIKEVYYMVGLWKIESDIEPSIRKIVELNRMLNMIQSNKGTSPDMLMHTKILEKHLNKMKIDMEKMYGQSLFDTKFFKYGKLRPEKDIKQWQIKNISDYVRKSLSNLFMLTKELDKPYSYEKNTKTITGQSNFIDRLRRNGKKILIFDDNISSGTTLDDICSSLIKQGIKKENLMVITLGLVKHSIYNVNTVRQKK